MKTKTKLHPKLKRLARLISIERDEQHVPIDSLPEKEMLKHLRRWVKMEARDCERAVVMYRELISLLPTRPMKKMKSRTITKHETRSAALRIKSDLTPKQWAKTEKGSINNGPTG